MNLELVASVPLQFEGGPAETSEYLLSPFVYSQGRAIAIRAVPNRDDEPELKISRIFRGRSVDGVRFVLENTPILAPSTSVDIGGVEDPTVVEDGDQLHVFYSGWNPQAKRSTLLRADGASAGQLERRGPVFIGKDAPEAKEATLLRLHDRWLMFFEREGATSLNGSASASSIRGPWTFGDDVVTTRHDYFDSANLSPAAFVMSPRGERVLIYNGAEEQAKWQVGWCVLDADCARVTDRCEAPILSASRNRPDQRELAFAASAIARDGLLDVYYSIADTDPMRATFRWSF